MRPVTGAPNPAPVSMAEHCQSCTARQQRPSVQEERSSRAPAELMTRQVRIVHSVLAHQSVGTIVQSRRGRYRALVESTLTASSSRGRLPVDVRDPDTGQQHRLFLTQSEHDELRHLDELVSVVYRVNIHEGVICRDPEGRMYVFVGFPNAEAEARGVECQTDFQLPIRSVIMSVLTSASYPPESAVAQSVEIPISAPSSTPSAPPVPDVGTTVHST